MQDETPIAWSKLEMVDAAPTRRSGHTLTMVGNVGYVYGGKHLNTTLYYDFDIVYNII